MGSDWEEIPFNDLGEVNRGRSRHRPRYAEHLYGGEYPFIQTGDIRGANGRIIEHNQTYSEDGLAQSRLWPTGTMCITIAANIAETAILTYPACFPDSVVGFIADESKCDVKFIEYNFRLLKRRLQSEAIGSVQDNINLATLSRLNIPLPTLPEQKAIAHILGSLDDKIELNRQMNETLESMTQALFKSWFVDFDPVIDNALAAGNAIPSPPAPLPEGEGGKSKKPSSNGSEKGSVNCHPLPSGEGLGVRESFPSELEYTEEMGWIPKGWGVKSVDDAILVNPRTALKKGEVAPFVDMKALPTSGYGISNHINKAYSGGAKFENKDVLFARITPCLENGKTGIVDFLEENEVGFGSTEFIILRRKNNIKTPFIACLARNDKFRAHAKLSMVGSSGRQRVQNACFTTFYLALPENDKLLETFDHLTKSNFKKITMLNNQSNTLSKLRDTLLPKLLSGELRIPDAEKLIEELTC